MEEDSGVLRVKGIMRGSPAEISGMQIGDIILQVGDVKPSNFARFRAQIRTYRPGESATIVYQRGEIRRTVDVRLVAAPRQEDLIRQQLVGHPAPRLSVELVEPEERQWDLEPRGKPLVLEFWATWCAPCRTVSQELTRIQDEFGDDIEIVAVSSESRKTIQRFLQRNPTKLPTGSVANTGGYDDYLVSSYPLIVLVDKEGRVASVFHGIGNERMLRARIQALLRE